MKSLSKNKNSRIRLPALLILSGILLLPLSACKSSTPSSLPLSPALCCVAEQSPMARSALKGNAITFSPEDFARAVNVSSIESITVTSVPPTTDGQLRVGSTVLSAGPKLSTSSISLMTYVPSSDINTSEFRFTVDDSPYELCCKLYILDKPNYAPTVATDSKTALEVSTHRSVTYFGTLPCSDPDGDKVFIEVVSYPKKGLLILDDATASYRYVPYEDSKGKDSFTYVAKDMYGNYSSSATVNMTINRKETPISYVDLKDSPYHNAALTMTEKEIMSGTQVGSESYFYPSKTVSREEFTVMAMNCAGIKELNPSSTSHFEDEDKFTPEAKAHINTAYELGYLGYVQTNGEGKLCFEGDREITRAEAAVMLASMLKTAAPTSTQNISDSSDIPTWARAAVESLGASGVLSYEQTAEGGRAASPMSAVTRGDAADMLTKFMSVKK